MLTTYWRASLILIGAVLGSRPGLAQQPGDGATPLAVTRARDGTAGSPTARTLRLLSLLAPDGVLGLGDSSRQGTFGWTTPQLTLWETTRRALNDRDGAVWLGRGATVSATGGLMIDLRWLSVALRPLAFATQNLPYDSGRVEPGIDLPHRLSARGFSRVDPGESWIKIEAGGLGLGVTTASQVWGPSTYYPLMFGTEGAAFPRLAATARDFKVGVGRLSGEWTMGVLEASPSSGLPAGARSRIGSGATFAFSPMGFPGLQLGATRFYHLRREKNGFSWSNATFPFSGLVKNSSRDVGLGGANQLASAFVRLAPKASGISIHGEFMRDDHNVDQRDLIVEPDHFSAVVVGVERAWRHAGELRAFSIERANGRYTHLHRVRPQGPLYTHVALTEGHTFRGQPLGSSAIVGGSGTRIQFDRVQAHRSRSAWLEVRASAQNSEGGTLDGRNVGHYSLNFTEWRTRGRRTLGWRSTLEWRYGSASAPNVGLSLLVR